MNDSEKLVSLSEGTQVILQNGRVVRITKELANAFRPGDKLVALQKTGEIKLIPSSESMIAEAAVSNALDGFHRMQSVSSYQIGQFFDHVARLLDNEKIWRQICRANNVDVDRTVARKRPIGRLLTTSNLRKSMISGVNTWKQFISTQEMPTEVINHAEFRVEVFKAPLGVVAFVFEGRPNVLIDACGVLSNGNSVVFRIGSDAIETARTIMNTVIEPALDFSGLPKGAITMVDSTTHASAWALFGDDRISLAVARGSGETTITLGAIAMQQGIPVSLHGKGGAWIVVGEAINEDVVEQAVSNSVDRKVCNTLNTLCLVRSVAEQFVPVVIRALEKKHETFRIHVVHGGESFINSSLFKKKVVVNRYGVDHEEFQVDAVSLKSVGTEWDWEESPEITLVVIDDVNEGIELFNKYSPRFVASLLSSCSKELQNFYDRIEAPFVGDDYTRWVDGQLALQKPELGLSNWQLGRLFSRGGILSGDGVYTLRTRYYKKA